MLTNLILIFVFVMASIIGLSLLANWLGGASHAWKALAERYPAQDSREAGASRSAIVFLSETDDPRGVLSQRGGCLFGWFAANRNSQNVRAVLDDYYFHLDLDSGAGGPKRPMSIPWNAVTIGQSFETHAGEHAALTIDEFTMLVPTASIERELLMRRAMQDQMNDNPFGEEEPYAS